MNKCVTEPEREEVLEDCFNTLNRTLNLAMKVTGHVRKIHHMMDKDFTEYYEAEDRVRKEINSNFRFGMNQLAKDIESELKLSLEELKALTWKLVIEVPVPIKKAIR